MTVDLPYESGITYSRIHIPTKVQRLSHTRILLELASYNEYTFCNAEERDIDLLLTLSTIWLSSIFTERSFVFPFKLVNLLRRDVVLAEIVVNDSIVSACPVATASKTSWSDNVFATLLSNSVPVEFNTDFIVVKSLDFASVIYLPTKASNTLPILFFNWTHDLATL